ncbi:thioredoxin [Ligilactobacillus sp. WC1T17]|uniref:Thioredoxin n=1 Tax=Ligilactobacillus ruminis TaxID=1623 RepID=A0ABY1A8R5_9LACO|nr:thioredoxin [Ligilactobacillus ruminis]
MAKKSTAQTFADDVQKAPLVVADFWAEWCAPCKMMEPVLQQLEQAFQPEIAAGQIKFLKVDVEHNQELALKQNIMNIPALLIFKHGLAKEKVTGYRKYSDMQAYLKQKLTEI